MFSVPKVGQKMGYESAGSLACAPKESAGSLAFATSESAGSLASTGAAEGGLNIVA